MIRSTTTGPNDEIMDSTGDTFDEYDETTSTISEVIEIIIKDFSELLDEFPDYYSPLEDSIIRKRDAIAPQKKSLEINVPIYSIPLGSRAPPPNINRLPRTFRPWQEIELPFGGSFATTDPLTGII